MKKKMVMLLLAGMVLCTAGCKEKETTEEPFQTVEQETEENSGEEAVTPEAETPTPEAETEEAGQEVAAAEDSTGIFPESGGVLEVPMGIVINGTVTTGCTVKLPANYLISGMGIDNTGAENDTLLYGDSLSSYWEKGILKEANVSSAMTIQGDTTLICEIYSVAEAGNLEGQKEYAPEGVEVGTELVPGYGYLNPVELEANQTQFSTIVQLNDELIVYLGYGGPLIEELGVQGLSEKLYELVTPLV
ncbi:MAG: hypothetical protein KH828_04610 [Clostridiales bacterium]|nr:hypothetical protein [Clostridiales bacterium]